MQETVVCTYIHFCRNKLRQLRSKCQNHRHRFLELADIHVRLVIVHQIFLLVRDWSKLVTWSNISQLNLGDIREYTPIFKTARIAQKIWRIINTIVSIWGENMLGYLSLDIICSSKLTVFLEPRSRKTIRFSEQIVSTGKYPSIFLGQMETIVYITLLLALYIKSLIYGTTNPSQIDQTLFWSKVVSIDKLYSIEGKSQFARRL